MRKKDKGVVKRFIVTPDKHFPLHSQPAIDCLIKAIHIVKPSGYIDLGDVGEWESASHWQWRKKKRPPLEYQLPYVEKEIEAVNAGMDMIDEALDKVNCKEKHMTEGNHDDWLNRFVDEHPYLKGMRFANAVNLKERGYKFHPIGKLLKIGKLNFYHGHHYAGIQHTRNHLLRMGANIMYGHHHDIQQSSVTHVDGPKSAWSIGCLKDMEAGANPWLNHRGHNWAHAFAVVDFFTNGRFTVHVVQIVDGETALWGEVIKA
mgnify:CR=1 FL=1|tara:strand:- start:3840 stop:4619 length:780 start_codon:yes stop_codon:yes gene_type:complete